MNSLPDNSLELAPSTLFMTLYVMNHSWTMLVVDKRCIYQAISCTLSGRRRAQSVLISSTRLESYSSLR